MRVVLISDTHNLLNRLQVPEGDILIHAGDATMGGQPSEIAAFNAQLGKLPHAHKIFVAGNHDWMFESDPSLAKALLTNATYLQDQEVHVHVRGQTVKLWGSPWTPRFHDWAFNADRGHKIRDKWDLIPNGLDVLVTHGPPRGHGSMTLGGTEAGCTDLMLAVERTKPRYHVFGHIHEGYGVTKSGDGATTFVNAASCTARYKLSNPPVVLDV